MVQKSYDLSPTVYIIPTPIGNFDDITYRALKVMKEVDVLFCEDTRTTGILLNHFGIKKKMIASHKFNENKNIDKVLSYLKDGLSVGIVSDQGTPLISDPGYIISEKIIEVGYNVVSLPGATALIPALTSSGLEINHFLFYGFLNAKHTRRVNELNKLKYEPYTLIFYETPHRIKETIDDLKNVLGNNRKISISREISKIHEEIQRNYLGNINTNEIINKGEFVIVVSGNNEKDNFQEIDILKHIEIYCNQGMKTMDAIKQVAKDRNMNKRDVYDKYIKKD